jgi:hypothetical protein
MSTLMRAISTSLSTGHARPPIVTLDAASATPVAGSRYLLARRLDGDGDDVGGGRYGCRCSPTFWLWRILGECGHHGGRSRLAWRGKERRRFRSDDTTGDDRYSAHCFETEWSVSHVHAFDICWIENAAQRRCDVLVKTPPRNRPDGRKTVISRSNPCLLALPMLQCSLLPQSNLCWSFSSGGVSDLPFPSLRNSASRRSTSIYADTLSWLPRKGDGSFTNPQ